VLYQRRVRSLMGMLKLYKILGAVVLAFFGRQPS